MNVCTGMCMFVYVCEKYLYVILSATMNIVNHEIFHFILKLTNFAIGTFHQTGISS